MEKRLRFTIILVLILVVVIAFSFRAKEQNEPLTYNKELDETALTVDGRELTLRDIAFYIAYEEKTIQEQAIVYNPGNPGQYWNLHMDGQFVRLTAKNTVVDMAVHDEIFYEMAVADKITLSAEETKYLENDENDFWSDLTDLQKDKLGISQDDLNSAMEKIALANKCQSIFAEMNMEAYESYNFDGDAYAKLLSEHEYSMNEEIWDRVVLGKVTLNN